MNQQERTALFSFPSSSSEAIAMLYLQNQDLAGKSPSEIQDMYYTVLKELHENWRTKWR